MIAREDLLNIGMSKLAYTEAPAPPAPPISPGGAPVERSGMLPGGFNINPSRPPTQAELKEQNDYAKAAILGALGGTAIGGLTGTVLKRSPLGALSHALIGAGAGTAGAIVRQYNLGADPPGLNPIYTVPAGIREGMLPGLVIGGVAGAKTSRTPLGVLGGMLTGGLAGGTGGALASPWM